MWLLAGGKHRGVVMNNMGRHGPLLVILSFFLLVSSMVVSHAVSSSEEYWNTAFPNTPLPKSLRDHLRNPMSVSKKLVTTTPNGKSVKAGENGLSLPVYFYYRYVANKDDKKRGDTAYPNTDKEQMSASGRKERYNYDAEKGLSLPVYFFYRYDLNKDDKKRGETAYPNTDKEQMSTASGGRKETGSPLLADRPPRSTTPWPINKPGAPFFFLEQDMQPGAVARLAFKLITNSGGDQFLTPTVAKSIPFSSSNLPQILDLLSIQPNSPQAEKMAEAHRLCERPTSHGEKKSCLATFESMVDFIRSSLGTQLVDLKTMSTSVAGEGEMDLATPQSYTILSSAPVEMEGPTPLVICHHVPYPYTVYQCHVIADTKPYVLTLAGEDGSTVVSAAAMCHDTSTWNAKSLALHALGIKPGDANVCHFLPIGDLAWLPTKGTDNGKGHLAADT